MKKLFLILIGMIFVAGCGTIFQKNTFHKKPTSSPSSSSRSAISTKLCSFDHFDSIVVGGDAEVVVERGYNTLELTGVRGSECVCQKVIHKNVLKIDSDSLTTKLRVKVGVHDLKNIRVTDNATVIAKNFSANDLTVIAQDSGSVNLQGKFSVQQVSQLGNGMISIGWIDSDKIKVDAEGGGPICLAGISSNLFVTLQNNSQLNARYLRTKNAKVFTTDKALAEVLVLNHLDAFAIDSSNIYYYKRPKGLTVVTRANANVLYPEWTK